MEVSTAAADFRRDSVSGAAPSFRALWGFTLNLLTKGRQEMKGKRRYVLMGLGLILAVALLLPQGVWAADKPIKWRFANLYPRATEWTPIYHQFCENVKLMSNGKMDKKRG